MNRPTVIYSIFGLCVLLVGGSLAWLSHQAIELDRRDAAAQRQTELAENIRLALWRMDSALTPIIAQENARPAYEYASYYNPIVGFDAADNRRLEPGSVMLPSPLLDTRSALVRLYFQIDADGRITSPQVPREGQPWPDGSPERLKLLADAKSAIGVMMAVAEPQTFWSNAPPIALNHDAPPIELAARRSDDRYRLPQPIDSPPGAPLDSPAAQQEAITDAAQLPAQADNSEPTQGAQLPGLPQVALADGTQPNAGESNWLYGEGGKQAGRARNTAGQQWLRSDAELQQRQQIAEQSKAIGKLNRGNDFNGYVQQQAADGASNAPYQEGAASPVLGKDAPEKADDVAQKGAPGAKPGAELPDAQPAFDAQWAAAAAVVEGGMEAKWIGQELVLLRQVRMGGQTVVQGVWLDWPVIRRWLLEQVRVDLLPQADLAPVADAAGADRMTLAAAPIRLMPGLLPGAGTGSIIGESLSPTVRNALIVAWASAALAFVAVTVLLRGAVVLSERRAAFVSAVTHELRTPLTTFKMYTQMLDEGMIADDEARRRYVGTLRTEADRLGHLVENVLAYARLERNRLTSRFESLPADELVARIADRLVDRARQADMSLHVAIDDSAAPATVSTDAAAVEQVLFNLVDNACKYAAAGSGDAAPTGDRRIDLRVTADADAVRFAVVDRGPGVCPDALATLFKPFSKSAQRAAVSAPGVGLGLALCRRLARRLGGDLTHDASHAPGCRFVLRLPRA